MDVGLAIAGFICVAMAFGHETIGTVWVLPSLTEERVAKTPFGPTSMTVGMIRVTWHVVTIFAFVLGGLLLTLAWNETADAKTVVLRWLAGMWLAAAAMAFWVVRHSLRDPRKFLRLPVPLLWIVVGVLCWKAST